MVTLGPRVLAGVSVLICFRRRGVWLMGALGAGSISLRGHMRLSELKLLSEMGCVALGP